MRPLAGKMRAGDTEEAHRMAGVDGAADVLVVEDDTQINELVGAYVQIAGYEYRSALDGAAALAAVKERLPSLIILDLMLPDTDGFEVARKLKSDEKTASVPIVMLTALDRDEQRKKGMDAGAVRYMTKPFDPDQLIDAIRSNATKR
jgi:two-component system phosphate regulon response regulator PhoB